METTPNYHDSNDTEGSESVQINVESSQRVESLFDVIHYVDPYTNEKCGKKHHHYWFWSNKYKALFGYMYGTLGIIVVLSMVGIQIYEVLITNNQCLFYYFNPPCADGGVINATLFH